jgi:hypothetical protein
LEIYQESKIWVFINRITELFPSLESALQAFLEKLGSTRTSLVSSYQLKYTTVLYLVGSGMCSLPGCSIDSSVEFIQP